MRIVERLERVGDGEQMLRVLLPDVDSLSEKILAIPSGSTRRLSEIGAELAQEQGADIACPTAMLRQLKVIAVIAHSAVTKKDPASVPFWRVIGEEGENLADKLAGGNGFSLAQRTREQRAGQSDPA